MRPCSLFIYYKVESAQADTLKPRVRAMQDSLRQRHPDLNTQLLVRVDAHPHQTWMEVYQHASGVDPSVQKDIERAALAMQADSCGQVGPRHTEVFAPCV
ncbi:DUF4936 family protein [Aquabacterium sp.]|uniref:DUF4936 family protein n=1 Tax=Aquabacterium sp. TaxID=1872578 RepID=UPI002E31D54B|nr:DUF4936 family protein [Aquabacterium sp.]HEX5311380.1 DUF4936 family protein [Aquabacterium sp.]